MINKNQNKAKQDPIIFYTTFRFLLAAGFLGFFACYNFFILNHEILQAKQDAALTLFMGNQCGLVQQVTLSSVTYAQSIDVEDRKLLREDIRATLQGLLFFHTTSNDIVSKETGLSLPLVRHLRKAYTAPPNFLNDQVENYISSVKKFLLGSPIRLSSSHPSIVELKNLSSKLVGALLSAGQDFQEKSERKIIWLQWQSVVFFILNLLCLVLVGIFVFRPIIKKTSHYLSQLKTVNEALEVKVAERTAELAQKADELEHSNQELRQQMEVRQKAEQDLLKANAFLDSIIENIPNMIFIKDAEELRFVRFNKAGEKLLGRPREEFLGKNDYAFFPQEQADFFTQKDRETLHKKELLDIPEEPLQTQNKELRILHTKKIPVMDSAGRPAYLLGISEDITEKIRSEEKLRELSLAMENALDGIARLDSSMNFLSVNKAYAAMMGYESGEMEGLNRLATVCPEDRDKARAAFEEMRESGKAEVEVKVMKKDGSVFHQYVVMVRAEDKNQNFKGFYSFAKDVTERKYRESLEIKSELIQIVSHELRTPIHSVKEGISIVLEGLTGKLTDEQREVLAIAERCADRLVRLVNNVLAFHKFEAGMIEFNIKKTNMNNLLQEIAEFMRPLAEDKGLSLGIQLQGDLPQIEADRDKIFQVLMNFLQNAIKFTPQGGITITSESKDQAIKVSVRDTGIGIQDKDLPKIFRKFGQIESAKLIAPGGTGLGLAIAKKIIEQHHGRIEVESEYQKGSCFSFILPLEQPKAPSPHGH